MYCVKCGVELADSQRVCPLCGTRVFHPDIPRTPADPPYPPDERDQPVCKILEQRRHVPRVHWRSQADHIRRLICAKQLLHVIVLHALSDAVIAKMVQLGFRSGTSRARQKDLEHASSGTLFARWTAVECRKFHCFLSSFVC